MSGKKGGKLMEKGIRKIVRRGGAAYLVLAGAALLCAQQKIYDGTWQMDAAKSHVLDGRTMTLVVATVGGAIKMTITSKKSDGQETSSEFTSKLDGKACDFDEGSHKSQLTMWWDGSALNASKEKGPAADVTSMWKWELTPDKQTLTLTINHYEPAADDEKIVFTKKA
jgi:hypothetical protein